MSIGLPQILLVLLLVVILFGVGKLPKVMGDMGKGVKNFKEGLEGEGEGDEPEATPAVENTASETAETESKKDKEAA